MLASFPEEKELFSVVSVLVFLFTHILGKSKCDNEELSRDKDWMNCGWSGRWVSSFIPQIFSAFFWSLVWDKWEGHSPTQIRSYVKWQCIATTKTTKFYCIDFLECSPAPPSSQEELKDLFRHHQMNYLHSMPLCKWRNWGIGKLSGSPSVAERKSTKASCRN